MKYDIYGIGHALLDILVQADDDFIKKTGYKKAGMHPIDSGFQRKLLDNLDMKKIRIIPAGAAVNTLMGIANLGGKAFYCGKTGDDKYGKMYKDDLESAGVETQIITSKTPTGSCVTMISPDTERTFFVFLGASQELKSDEINYNPASQSKIIYFTGYEIENPVTRECMMKAISSADKNSKIAFDLADQGVVKRNKEFLKEFVEKHVDILFANETETKAFLGEATHEAIKDLAKMCEVVVVKLREKGAVLVEKDNLKEIDIFRVKAIDSTGAGDLFAAGFLYGYTKDLPLDLCARIGSFVASKTVSQIGARLEKNLKKEVEELIKNS